MTLFTAFHRRYNDNVLALLDEIPRRGDAHGGIVGCRVRYFERIEEHCGDEAWYLDPRRSGGGCIADNGPNALDVLDLLLGPLIFGGAALHREGGIDRRAAIDVAGALGARGRVELDWSYDDGELKDVTVVLRDGTTLAADMLAGHAGFKASLWHEYVGVLEDFAQAVWSGSVTRPHDLRVVELVEQSYRLGEVTNRVALDVT